MNHFKMRPTLCYVTIVAATLLAASAALTSAFLIQPYNYMLDDSAILSPASHHNYHNNNNQQQEDEQAAGDKDIIGLLSDGFNRLKYGRMMQQQQHDAGDESTAHLSQEMADLINEKQQQQSKDGAVESVADILLNVAQAAADAAANNNQHQQQQQDQQQQAGGDNIQIATRGSIMELDTSRQSIPSKSDMKESNQWYNPKEIIPALKISAMATPSKYKKVYFRAEKKLVDGAFHQPDGSESGIKKEYYPRSFKGGNVQRRSSKASTANSPPSLFENGVIDFLKKFRDVYVQTRPVQAGGGSAPINPFSSAGATASLANVLAAAASSPAFSAVLAPSSMSASSSSLAGGKQPSSSAAAAANSALGAASNAAGQAAISSSNTVKSPLSAQTYVSFWSKTFPTWVKKMLKQFRRRSLYNSSKRQQQKGHNQHSQASLAVQAAGAIANAADQASNSGSSSGSGQSSQQR